MIKLICYFNLHHSYLTSVLSNNMQTYILLIRGINVGGNNKLPMKALIELLSNSHLALHNIQTYLQTGNVVFQSLNDSSQINESAFVTIIEKNFGFRPEIIMLNKAEFDLAINNNPYKDELGKTCHFYFCKEAPQLDIARLEKYITASESYQLHDNVFYLHAPEGIGRSKLAANVETCVGAKATARNLNTVNKIATMIG